MERTFGTNRSPGQSQVPILPPLPIHKEIHAKVRLYLDARGKSEDRNYLHFKSRSHGQLGYLKSALEAWFTEARNAKWKNSAEVKRLYATASIVSSDRVVFNVKGNDYRLVVAIDYEKGIVWIKWIGTHAEYDGIDVRTVNYEESKAAAK